jgi:cytosine/adenosine deaminase-related metal-dependent hydrolase
VSLSVAVRELLEAGVPIAAGGDGSHEPPGPEHADPLGTASDLVAARLTPAEAMTAISAGGRQVVRIPPVAVVPGSPADLVAIRAPDLWDAVTARTADRIVLRGGRIVARSVAIADPARQERAIVMSGWNLPQAAGTVGSGGRGDCLYAAEIAGRFGILIVGRPAPACRRVP